MITITETLGIGDQITILDSLRQALALSPLQTFIMPARGIARRANCTGLCQTCFEPQPGDKRFHVQSANLGEYGWYSNRCDYIYTDRHPLSGEPFPPIPSLIADIARRTAQAQGFANFEPQSAYLNWYTRDGRLGLHQDKSERRMDMPIISISIGADADFLIGGQKLNDPTRILTLKSGDILIMGGEHRLTFHGIAGIHAESTPPELHLKTAGRLNLTIRQYT